MPNHLEQNLLCNGLALVRTQTCQPEHYSERLQIGIDQNVLVMKARSFGTWFAYRKRNDNAPLLGCSHPDTAQRGRSSVRSSYSYNYCVLIGPHDSVRGRCRLGKQRGRSS